MNSKQRRKERRKFPHVVDFGRGNVKLSSAFEMEDWIKENIQGEYRTPNWHRTEFTNEQDAIMFSLKFSGNLPENKWFSGK